MSRTPLDEFHNRLRIMLGIESDELIAAGAVNLGDIEKLNRFHTAPFHFFIRADDRTAEAIWSIIEARSMRRLPS